MILVLLSKHESTHDRLIPCGPRTDKILDFSEGLNASVAQNRRWGIKVLFYRGSLYFKNWKGFWKLPCQILSFYSWEETHAWNGGDIVRLQNHLVAELGKNPDSECHSSSVYFISTVASAVDPRNLWVSNPFTNIYVYKALNLYWMSFRRSLNVMCSCNTESLVHHFVALTGDSVLYS